MNYVAFIACWLGAYIVFGVPFITWIYRANKKHSENIEEIFKYANK